MEEKSRKKPPGHPVRRDRPALVDCGSFMCHHSEFEIRVFAKLKGYGNGEGKRAKRTEFA